MNKKILDNVESVGKKIDDVEKAIKQGDFYEVYQDEKHAHKITRVYRNVFLVWAIIATALLIGMLGFFSRFTYLEPSQVITHTYEQDGTGMNNINTGSQGDVVNESEIH